MAGNRNSGMGSPLCSGVCWFYLPPRSYIDIHEALIKNIISFFESLHTVQILATKSPICVGLNRPARSRVHLSS